MLTVTMMSTSKTNKTWTHNARTTDPEVALRRFLDRHFGRRSGWWADSGLPGYGQVIEPAPGGGSSCVTDRCRLDIE